MLDSSLHPHIDELNAPFWEGCRQGVLRIQQCPQSGRLMFPPRPLNSWAPDVAPIWTDVSGHGTIWSAIEPHPPLMLDFTELAPYNAIVVALDEDPSIRLVGNLVADAGDPINALPYDHIEIGAAVTVVFERISDEISLPRWRLR